MTTKSDPIEKRKRFRQQLSGPDCVFAADVFDPISARIAEDLGFKIGMLAGSVASMTVLGAPDMTVLTMSELADQVRRICRAANLPLLVDADHGYGNALNVGRTVEELEAAGVAALTIEDTLLPAPFDGDDKSLIPVDEGVGKIRAALAARQDQNLVVVARTAAASVIDVDVAIERGKAYSQAGADALFFSGVRTRGQVAKLKDSLDLPLLFGAVPAEVSDPAWLGSMGVRICLQGHRPFLAAVKATYEALKALAEGVPPDQIKDIAGDDLLKRSTRRDAYARSIDEFLKSPKGREAGRER